jgi:hypothetical protein
MSRIWRGMIAVGLTAVSYGMLVVSGTDPANLPARAYDRLARALCSKERPGDSYWCWPPFCGTEGVPPKILSSYDHAFRPCCVACKYRWARAIVYEVPSGSITLVSYGLLTRILGHRAVQTGESLCRKCGHILRGLTEPRCPECGERI